MLHAVIERWREYYEVEFAMPSFNSCKFKKAISIHMRAFRSFDTNVSMNDMQCRYASTLSKDFHNRAMGYLGWTGEKGRLPASQFWPGS